MEEDALPLLSYEAAQSIPPNNTIRARSRKGLPHIEFADMLPFLFNLFLFGIWKTRRYHDHDTYARFMPCCFLWVPLMYFLVLMCILGFVYMYTFLMSLGIPFPSRVACIHISRACPSMFYAEETSSK